MVDLKFDHLVFAGPNLEMGIAYFERLLGVSAVLGGSHPGLGTCNAYIGLGTHSYLEIIAPDPEQSHFSGIRPFNIDRLNDIQLVTWVARQDGLGEFVDRLRKQDIELGMVIPVSRLTPEGSLLNWNLTFAPTADLFSLVPFFIDWGNTPHPSKNCPPGAVLRSLVLETPHPVDTRLKLERLGLNAEVIESTQPGISVVIDCPNGEINLTSGNAGL